MESRSVTVRSNPEPAERLLRMAQRDIDERWNSYEQMAGIERSVPERMEEVQA
jgi:pyruvate-ferredoxin/flavodoxin oxidoreductase